MGRARSPPCQQESQAQVVRLGWVTRPSQRAQGEIHASRAVRQRRSYALGLRQRRFGTGWGAWLVLACCSALLGCGGRSSHSTDVELDAGGGGASSGGKTGAGGSVGNAGRGELSGGNAGATCSGMAGSDATTGGETALGGSAGELGASGPVNLCLYPDQIPDNWDAGDASATSCAVGELGQFVFDGCRYELLDVEANDADPFQGGHSHCCYHSTLLGCP
jgi:hypothetical protein